MCRRCIQVVVSSRSASQTDAYANEELGSGFMQDSCCDRSTLYSGSWDLQKRKRTCDTHNVLIRSVRSFFDTWVLVILCKPIMIETRKLAEFLSMCPIGDFSVRWEVCFMCTTSFACNNQYLFPCLYNIDWSALNTTYLGTASICDIWLGLSEGKTVN